MSQNLAPISGLEEVSRTALRSLFGEGSQALVLAALPRGAQGELHLIQGALDILKNRGVSARLVVYGDSSAILPNDLSTGAIEGENIAFLERWSRPVLSSVLEVVDVLIAVGCEGEALAINAAQTPRAVPVILTASETKSWGRMNGGAVLWDGKSIESLAEALGDILARSEQGERAALPTRDPIESPPSRRGACTPEETSSGDVNRPKRAEPEPRAPARLVLQNDWGIGDELLLSAVAREIVRSRPDAQVWIRSRYGFPFPSYVRKDPVPADARVVDTIYQNPVLYGPRCHSPYPGHLVQQMLDKVALDTRILVKALDPRPELDLSDLPQRGSPDPRSVVLHTRPNPRLPSKDWGLKRWEELAVLLKEQGVHLRQVGGKDEPLLPDVEDLRGLEVRELPGVLARSGGVVCLVGFLMHLAEAVRTPAVVIYGGREHPAIDGYPDQVHLASGPLACRGRWGCNLGPDLDCPNGMRCMEELSPDLVADETLSLLADSAGGDQE